MMFCRLLLVSPLLAAGEVCQGEFCQGSEETAMLQLKGRETPEANALLQRSQMTQTLRSLEENLMGKDGVDRAKCTYYLKDAEGDAMTPCEQLEMLEKTFQDSVKDFRDFSKIAKETVERTMAALKASIADGLSGPSLEGVQVQFTLGLSAEGTELQKLTESIEEAEEKLGLGSEFTEALGLLTQQIQTNVKDAVTGMQQDVSSMLKGEDVTLPDGQVVTLALLLGSESGTEKLAEFIDSKFDTVMNTIHQEVAQFWRTVLRFPGESEDPFVGLDWSKDAKTIEKLFWQIAKGYLDAVDHIEDGCKSAAFQNEKDFVPRQICKSNDKPSCTDEFLYLGAVAGIDDTAACAQVDGLTRKGKVTDLEFMTSAGICKSAKDLRKACQIIAKAEQVAAKKAAKKSGR